jgi:hypothetical protein
MSETAVSVSSVLLHSSDIGDIMEWILCTPAYVGVDELCRILAHHDIKIADHGPCACCHLQCLQEPDLWPSPLHFLIPNPISISCASIYLTFSYSEDWRSAVRSSPAEKGAGRSSIGRNKPSHDISQCIGNGP